jgi:Protein of unknown function (DUF3134)
MTTIYNPALSEEPRNQPMKVVPLLPRESILSWLERTGRFKSSEIDGFPDCKTTEDLDDLLEPEVYVLENEEDQLN